MCWFQYLRTSAVVARAGWDTGHYYKIKRTACAHAISRASRQRRTTCSSIGGGIHGLTIAYEAASRGLRTALVEARRLRQRRLVQSSEDRARRPALAAVREPAPRAREHPRTSRAGAHRAVVSPAAPLHRRHLPLGRAQPAGASRRRSSSTAGSDATATTASSRSCTCPRRGSSRKPRRCGCFPASGRTS